ncbi:unnamed protein product [Lampetra fluviatilis]
MGCSAKSFTQRELLLMALSGFLLAVCVALSALLGTGVLCADPDPVSLCSSFPCPASCDQALPPCNGLVFEELWDQLDMDTWEHEITLGGGGNWEFQHYTNNRSNSYVRDGLCSSAPRSRRRPTTRTSCAPAPSTSGARLRLTRARATRSIGCERSGNGGDLVVNPVQSGAPAHRPLVRLHLRARRAIWMLPKRNAYGGWPSSGEIDIVECRGNANLKDAQGVSHGVDEMGSTMHWGPYPDLNSWPKTHATKFLLDGEETLKVNPTADGFWGLGAFPNNIDNPWKGRGKMAPFDQDVRMRTWEESEAI